MPKRGIALRAPALRILTTLLILLALASGPALPALDAPSPFTPATASAASATVSTCDESGFDAALQTVQAAGGGTIYFTCTGTIGFGGQKTITSNVTIINTAVTIFGVEVAFQGSGSDRLFLVDAGAQLALSGIELFGGAPAGGSGGLIYNLGTLDLIGSTLDQSSGDLGGAIYNDGGTISINGSVFTDNNAIRGGAIFNAAGEISITGSTFDSNILIGGVTTTVGGAIYNENGTLTIAASTFTQNAADFGGAIANDSGGVLDITGSTFSSNAGFNAGAGLSNSPGATTTIRASIMDNSPVFSGNCYNGGNLISDGYNHSSDQSCGFGATGDRQDTGTVLSFLAANGGPTPTMLPDPTAFAIDAIPAADCQTYTTSNDQRGVPRFPENCDVGAVELGQVPVQVLAIFALADDGHPQGNPVEIVVLAFGPSGAALTYAFDCNDDGSYEIGPQPTPSAACVIQSEGIGNITVEVCHNSNCGTAGISIDIANVDPTITGISSDAPVDEGTPVTINVTATDPGGEQASLTAYADCDDSGDFETTGAGLSLQCIFGDDGTYPVPIMVADGDGGSATSSISVTVINAPPVISDITSSPVNGAGSVTITVFASDPAGVHDPLSFAFDCSDNGDYEVGPQPGNSTTCVLNPAAASTTIAVEVSDGDGGVASGSVRVDQTVTLCASYYTGTLSSPRAGDCPSGAMKLVLPAAGPTTFCIDPYGGTLRWSPRGSCPGNARLHIVPDDGPLAYCKNLWTGAFRYNQTGGCLPHEVAGVIPG